MAFVFLLPHILRGSCIIRSFNACFLLKFGCVFDLQYEHYSAIVCGSCFWGYLIFLSFPLLLVLLLYS